MNPNTKALVLGKVPGYNGNTKTRHHCLLNRFATTQFHHTLYLNILVDIYQCNKPYPYRESLSLLCASPDQAYLAQLRPLALNVLHLLVI